MNSDKGHAVRWVWGTWMACHRRQCLARSHGCQRAGAKAQRQETIWQGIHKDQDTAISLGLRTFVQMSVLATPGSHVLEFHRACILSQKEELRQSGKSQEKYFVKEDSENQDVFS